MTMTSPKSKSRHVDEQEPLLRKSSSESVPQYGTTDFEPARPADSSQETPKKKISLIPLLLICVFRLTQPMFFMVIAPFINRMLVEELKVSDEIHVGHYSGITESMAAVGMCAGVFVCSRLSDRYGRKPVALIGVGTSSLLCAAFGFARRYWLLVVIRFGMGFAISAQASTSRVMLSEMSDIHDLSQNFVYAGIAWQIGSTLGPTLGGLLARPAVTWPSVFQGTFFETYPYALPSMAAASIPGIAVLVGIFYLEETRTFSQRKDSTPLISPISAGLSNSKSGNGLLRPYHRIKTALQEMVYPTNGLPPLFSCGEDYMILVVFSMVFQAVAFGTSELLLLFSSPRIGGLDLTQPQLAFYCAIRPLCIFFYELIFFMRVSKLVGGNIRLVKLVVWAWPIIYCIYLAASQLSLAGKLTTERRLVALVVSLTLQVIANSSFLCCEVLQASRAPTVEQLSTVTAMMEVVGQISVGLAAAFSSSLYAGSAAMHDGFFRFKLVWIVLFGIAVGMALVVMRITHIDGWKEKQVAENERETSIVHGIVERQ